MSNSSRVLRHRIDAISVLAVVLALGFQLAAFFLKWPWYAVFPIILLMRWSHLVEHNHAHLPIFHQDWLNEILGWMTFLNGGIALEFYRLQHVRTHHKYTNQEGDWTSPFQFEGCRYPDKPVNYWYYIFTYSIIGLCHCLTIILRQPGSRMFNRLLASVAVVGSISVWLLYLDPWRFLLFFYVTWWAAYIGVPVNNWDHHVDCEYTDEHTSANVDLRLLCRWLGFNIGYHSAHHWRPTLHWSRLEEFHNRRMANKIPTKYYRPVKPAPTDTQAGAVEKQA